MESSISGASQVTGEILMLPSQKADLRSGSIGSDLFVSRRNGESRGHPMCQTKKEVPGSGPVDRVMIFVEVSAS